MRTAHLFAGAGGGLLSDLILGHTPVLAVELVESCCNVLRERAAEGWFPGLHVHCGDVKEFDFTPWRGRVDCLAAGFPCQDISAAGTGKGITGARSGLVSEVFRAIDVLRPRFVFLENSPRIRTRGRDVVIGELVARGYSWRDGILGAADVGAPHQRDRWWCLAANADGVRQLESERCIADQWLRTDNGTEKTADALRQGCKDGGRIAATQKSADQWRPADVAPRETIDPGKTTWFEVEPNVGRLVYGVADGVVPGAVKALGNGQVPLCAAAAWLILSRR